MNDPKTTDAISRSAVIDRLEMLRRNYTLKAGYRDAMTDAIGEARNAPALDVAPVVHARWIHDINNLYGCSKCMKRETMSHKKQKKYCPNCGARMDGEAE